MKPLRGKWLPEAIDYMLSYPRILINDFKAAGITDAFGIAVDLINKIANFTESESNDEHEELLHVNRSSNANEDENMG